MFIFSRADIISFASMEFKLIGLLKSKKEKKKSGELKSACNFFWKS